MYFRAYLAEVVEVCHIFCKIMEHFCRGGVVVQKKQTKRNGAKRSNKTSAAAKKKPVTPSMKPLTEVC